MNASFRTSTWECDSPYLDGREHVHGTDTTDVPHVGKGPDGSQDQARAGTQRTTLGAMRRVEFDGTSRSEHWHTGQVGPLQCGWVPVLACGSSAAEHMHPTAISVRGAAGQPQRDAPGPCCMILKAGLRPFQSSSRRSNTHTHSPPVRSTSGSGPAWSMWHPAQGCE